MNFMEWWFSKFSFNLFNVFFFPFPGQLRSWTSPPSGRSTSPHCSTHRSPPFTPPTSVASCRSRRLLPRHACSELCPKWKRTQGWERWEQTSTHNRFKYRKCTTDTQRLCSYLSPKPLHYTPLHNHTHNHTDMHRPLFEGENAEWRHCGPRAACRLVQSMQM